MTQKVTSNSIESVDASKLSGDHTNATDGQNLTGINDGIIESASDPTASSNPTGGLGTLWVNYTSGEMYNLTNASPNANYWTNVGGQSGDIFYQYSYQGAVAGFSVGGETHQTDCQKWSFINNGSNAQWGPLSRIFQGQTMAGKGTDYAFLHGQEHITNSNQIISKMQYATANSSSNWGSIGFASQHASGTTDSDNDYFFQMF